MQNRKFNSRILLIISVICCAVILSACGSTTASQADKKDYFTFSNVTIKSESGFTKVIGEAKNSDKKKHTFTYTVSLLDKDNKLLGTVSGTITDIGPGDTKNFEINGKGEYANVASHKFQIDNILE